MKSEELHGSAALQNNAERGALDERIFAQLGRSIPAPQLRQLYSMSLDDARNRISAMRGLAAAEDNVHLMHEAHSIKGSAGMLGATEIYALASQLETSGLDAPGLRDTKVVNPLDELDAACDRLQRILGSRA